MHDVGCHVELELTRPSVLAIQVAPATSAGTVRTERFRGGR